MKDFGNLEQAGGNKMIWSVMDFLLDEVVLIDRTGQILWVNQAWRDFASENAADEKTRHGVGLNYFEVCRKASLAGDLQAEGILRGLEAVSQGKQLEYTVDYPCRTPQTEYWFRMRAVALNGEHSPLVITHHNISDRVVAEKAYQSESERFYSLVNSMADIVFLLDTEGRHVGVYGQWVEKYGLRAEMFIGKTAREILGDEAAQVHEEANRRALSGENVLYEWSFQDQSGEHVIQTHLSPIRDLAGKIQGIVGVGRDLTERVRIERLLGEQTQNLSRLTEFAAHLQGLETAEEVYQWLTQQVGEILQVPKALIAIRDRQTDILEARSPAFGFTPSEIAAFRFSVREGEKIWDFSRQGALLANGLEELPLGFRDFAQRMGFDSVLAVQIDLEEHMGGLILAVNKAQGFTEQDQHTLEIIAHQAAGVLTRLQLHQQLHRQLKELQVLHLVSTCGVQAETEDELITHVTEIVGGTLYPDSFGVLLLQKDENLLKPHPSYRGATPEAKSRRYPLGKESIASLVAQTRQAQRIQDVSLAEHYYEASPQTKSELCVPIQAGDEILGVLNVESCQIGRFTPEDERLVTTIATLLATALLRLRRAEAERRARGIAESLVKTAHTLSSELDSDAVLAHIFKSLEQILPYHSATIVWREDPGRGEVWHKGVSLVSDAAWLKFAVNAFQRKPQEAILFQVDEKGEISTCPDSASPAICCGIAALLVDSRNSLGILALEGVNPDLLKQEVFELVTVFAEQAALSLRNASLYSRAVQDAERRAALHMASQELIQAGYDVEKIYLTLHKAVAKVMPAEAFVLSMLDEDRTKIRVEYAVDRGGRYPKQVIPLHQGLSGWVIEHKKSLIVEDLLSEPKIAAQAIHFGTQEPVRSLVAVPLRLHQQVHGMIAAQSYSPSSYSLEDVEWLELLAANAAGILQNAQLYRETQLRAEEMTALLETTRDLATIQDTSSVLESILERATRLLDLDSGGIYLYDRQQNNLELVAVKNIPVSVGLRLELGEGVAGKVAKELKPVMVDHYAAWEGRSPKYDGIPFTYSLGVPMISGGELMGVIGATAIAPSQRKPRPNDAVILQMFASHAASAVQVARYYDQSQRRLRELEVINNLSKALRSALNSQEMIAALLTETTSLFGCEAGSVWLFDPLTMKLTPRAVLGWLQDIQQNPLSPGEGLVGLVYEEGKPLICNEFVKDERATQQFRAQAPAGWGGIVMPIASLSEVIGAFVIGFPTQRLITEEELTLISAFCEIAGNALQRAQATEQLERRVQQLLSLRTIDNAINSSLDLGLTLDILLEQVLAHVHAEAADILLYDQRTYSLKMVAQRGFKTVFLKPLNIPVSPGILARILNDRQIQLVANLADIDLDDTRQALLKSEGFGSYVGIPLIAKGEIVGVLEIFRRSLKLIPADELDFLETLSGQAAIAIENTTLFYDLQQTNTQLSLAYDSTLEGWARALELRDNETEGHSRRVADLTLRLAEALGVPEPDWIHIHRGTLLHDIGKMGIPDEILHKAGPLNDAEWEVMKQHPLFAYQLLKPIQFLEKAAVIPYCHHERWDGSGYPQGLRGEQIPLAARIFAVVDVYDALCSDRPYRAAWSKQEALNYIKEQAGKLFDPRVVEAFITLIE